MQTVGTGVDIVYLDVSEASGTVTTDIGRVVIDNLAAHLCTARHTQRGNTTFRIRGRTCKHFEFDRAHQVSNLDQFKVDAQIRFVRSVAMHSIRIGHSRKRLRQIDLHRLFENVADHTFHGSRNSRFVDKTHFDIELCEFRLAIGTQILVSEAANDLIVAIQTRHHQQLLEDLG